MMDPGNSETTRHRDSLPPVTRSRITAKDLQRYLAKPDPVILEIGCNDGGHTLWFREIFDAPRIYCFEPDPRAIERFAGKVEKRPGVELFELALSDCEGEITVYESGGSWNESCDAEMPGGWDKSGSIRKPGRHLDVYPSVTFERSIQVKTTSLDAWCAEHGVQAVDFIWMDVQGAELDVFRGAPETLRKTRYLYTE